MEHKWEKSQNIVSFIKKHGGRTINLVQNPKEGGKRFFVLEGTDISGSVTHSVEKLSAELSVSWYTPPGAKARWTIHPTRNDNLLDSFSI